MEVCCAPVEELADHSLTHGPTESVSIQPSWVQESFHFLLFSLLSFSSVGSSSIRPLSGRKNVFHFHFLSTLFYFQSLTHHRPNGVSRNPTIVGARKYSLSLFIIFTFYIVSAPHQTTESVSYRTIWRGKCIYFHFLSTSSFKLIKGPTESAAI